MAFKSNLTLFITFAFLFTFCEQKEKESPILEGSTSELTIFFINDQHGQIDNFSKVKHIVDQERAKTNTLLVCAGDMFSGNPIVDQYKDKGFPMIDVMNQTGFDVAVLGNHEFDYGTTALKERMGQAEFAWVCANVDMQESGVPQPNPFVTVDLDGLKITFLGLVETFGKPGAIIPATHPWRVSELKFERHYDVISQYADLKSAENSDILVALTHLGSRADRELAIYAPFLDLVIGGHSHEQLNDQVGSVSIVQAGSYLNLLGKISLTIQDQKIIGREISFIDLREYTDEDQSLKQTIEAYNDAPEFDQVVGYATAYHDRTALGCFYTDALKAYLDVDVSFQNRGGIRADINEGNITKMEIYQMDPFNNQSVTFTLTAGELSDFFKETQQGLYVSGITFEEEGGTLYVLDENGIRYAEDDIITIGTNDYIPSVHDSYFPLEKAVINELTTAETIIEYLVTIQDTVSRDGCNKYYRYN
ncbi:MAG: bifunctional metallophosphatase/5'-nucleotidase [Cyclobacteriaceae bacterium]